MFKKPFQEINERIDAVTQEVVSVTKLGTVAFILVSIVAVTALVVTIGAMNNASKH